MRLKLKEAAQPISKLDYNIQNVVLPTLNKYGFNFEFVPQKMGSNEYYFSSYSDTYDGVAELNLTTSHRDMDAFNAENPELMSDLYATLEVNGEKIILGPISSKDADSIVDVLDNEDNMVALENSKPMTNAEINDIKLYEPKSPNSGYGPMTAAEWQKELQKVTDAIDTSGDEESYRKTFNKYQTFIKSIYPLA